MPEPALAPIPPTPGAAYSLGSSSPAWIGRGAGCAIQIFVPGVVDRHAALVEREDGWWASEGQGSATLNGIPLKGTVRLRDGDVLGIAPGYQYSFRTGAAPVKVAPRDEPSPAPRRTRRKRTRAPGTPRPWAMIGVVALIVVLVGAAAYGIWRATHGTAATAPLTDRQASEFDSLLVVAYDHIERGGTVLELGLADAAAQEFARGVNTLALSDLRDLPQVKPRIAALEGAVGAIYRERKLTVPHAYAGARTTLSPEKLRQASLTVAQFAAAFAQVATAYQARFGEPIVVSGRDHAEHLTLYGSGGALDLRTKTMSVTEIQFVIGECRNRSIRVKDFTQDSILRRQVAAAMAAGLLDRAGTGLHLHIDRFARQRDRWTVAFTSAGT